MGLGLFWVPIFVLLVCVVVVFCLCVLFPALVFACSVRLLFGGMITLLVMLLVLICRSFSVVVCLFVRCGW